MVKVIIDTSVIFAYFSKKDLHHERAKKIMEDILRNYEWIINEHIFDEIINVTMRKINKIEAIKVGIDILNSEILIIDNNRFTFDKTWEIFQKNENLSFTDCSLIACAEIFDIKQIATFDKHFKEIKGIEIIS